MLKCAKSQVEILLYWISWSDLFDSVANFLEISNKSKIYAYKLWLAYLDTKPKPYLPY